MKFANMLKKPAEYCKTFGTSFDRGQMKLKTYLQECQKPLKFFVERKLRAKSVLLFVMSTCELACVCRRAGD